MMKFKFSKSDVYFMLIYLAIDLFVVALEQLGNIPTLYAPIYGLTAAYASAKGFRALPTILLAGLLIHAPILYYNLKSVSALGLLAINIGVSLVSMMFGIVFGKYFYQTNKENFLNNFNISFLKFALITAAAAIPIGIFAYFVILNLSNYSSWQALITSTRFYIGIYLGVLVIAPVLIVVFSKNYKSYISIQHLVTYAMSIIITTAAIFFVEVTNVKNLKSTFNNYAMSIEDTHRTNIINLVDHVRLLKNNLQLLSKGDEQKLIEDFKNSPKTPDFIKSIFLSEKVKSSNHRYLFKTYYSHETSQPDSTSSGQLKSTQIQLSEKELHKYTGFFAPLKADTSKVTNDVILYVPYDKSQSGHSISHLVGVLIDYEQFLESSYNTKLLKEDSFLLSLTYDSVFKFDQNDFSLAYSKTRNAKNVSKTDAFTFNSNFKYLNLAVKMNASMPPIFWRTASELHYWWILLTILLIHIGLTRIQFFLIMRDIELKKINATLEARVKIRTELLSKRTRELEALFKVIPDALFTMEENGKVLKLKTNSKKSTILDAFFDNELQLTKYLKITDMMKFNRLLNNSIYSSIADSHVFEFHKDKIIIYCELTFVKYNEENSLIMLRDVTEKHKLQKRIEMQNIQALSHAKLASLGEMAAGIAHEINNPLTIIDGSAQVLTKLIENDAENLEIEKANKALSRINRTVLRIASIVNGLRKYTREDKNEIEKVILASFIEESLSFCRERFASQGVPLTVDIKTRQRFIYCNPIEFSQVLVNLLNNAFDAVKNTPEKWVKVLIEDDTELLLIRVIDSGSGIPKAIEYKIMQPFYTTKAIGQGTGLGLSISQSIVKAHRGILTYEQYQGHTCFKIAIPREQMVSAVG